MLVAGAVVASVVWLLVVVLSTTTPEEARERRAVPDLGVPTGKVERTVLRQVTAGPCTREAAEVPVKVPSPVPGSRSVLTQVARSGSPVKTGTVLARVAGRPLVAVVTDAVLYRDLQVGDRGPDVRGVEQAMAAAGLIGSADDQLDAATMAAWGRIDDAASGRIELARLVAVPAHASVAGVAASVGDAVKPGSSVMTLAAASSRFVCEVDAPGGTVTTDKIDLTLGSRSVKVAAVAQAGGGDDASDAGLIVTPVGKVKGDRAEVSIEFSASEGKVLAVPIAAIKTTSDGATGVVVVDGDERHDIKVTVGVTAQGVIEVAGKGLHEGDDVQLFDPADDTRGSLPLGDD